jgi:flagellar biosynthesis GTPase FlhF
MNARPVTHYRNPRYPTRLEVLADHTLLEKHLPPAWKSCAEMAGVVTLLLATNSSLGFSQNRIKGLTGKPAVVAPIFEHGGGRGAVGCVVVNPPVFLSEQDAMQVIREQLGKAGVNLSAKHVALQDVVIPQFKQEFSQPGWNPKVVPVSEAKVFFLDALDPQNRVGVEFVTDVNYFDLGGERSGSTVQDYDLKRIAAGVDKSVAKSHDLYFGAVYDPVNFERGDPEKWSQLRTLSDERNKLKDPQLIAQKDVEIKRLRDEINAESAEAQRRMLTLFSERLKLKDPKLIAQKDAEIRRARNELLAPARARSHELLQQQVKDFIEWLKGQGVI